MDDLKTLGEARVRTDFNVSGTDYVTELKAMGAKFINTIDGIAAPIGLPKEKLGEFVRLKSLAMTEIESGTSWAVKAATTKSDTF